MICSYLRILSKMGDWMVCISAILACWVTLTSAQLNICKLRLGLRNQKMFHFVSGRHGRGQRPGQSRSRLSSEIFGVRESLSSKCKIRDLPEERDATTLIINLYIYRITSLHYLKSRIVCPHRSESLL